MNVEVTQIVEFTCPKCAREYSINIAHLFRDTYICDDCELEMTLVISGNDGS